MHLPHLELCRLRSRTAAECISKQKNAEILPLAQCTVGIKWSFLWFTWVGWKNLRAIKKVLRAHLKTLNTINMQVKNVHLVHFCKACYTKTQQETSHHNFLTDSKPFQVHITISWLIQSHFRFTSQFLNWFKAISGSHHNSLNWFQAISGSHHNFLTDSKPFQVHITIP